MVTLPVYKSPWQEIPKEDIFSLCIFKLNHNVSLLLKGDEKVSPVKYKIPLR